MFNDGCDWNVIIRNLLEIQAQVAQLRIVNESIAFIFIFSQNLPNHFNLNISRMIINIHQNARKRLLVGVRKSIKPFSL